MRTRSLPLVLLLSTPGWVDPRVSAQSRAPLQEHEATLSHPRVSELGDGVRVVTFLASGDLAGLLTLRLASADEWSIGGEWSLVARYAVDRAAHAEGDEDGNHEEHLVMLDRGTLGGSVDSGRPHWASDGGLEAIEALQLSVVSGSLEFEGSRGAGSADAGGLGSWEAGAGTLRLVF